MYQFLQVNDFVYQKNYLEHPSTCVYRPRLYGDIAGLGLKIPLYVCQFQKLSLDWYSLDFWYSLDWENRGYINNRGYIGANLASIFDIASIDIFWSGRLSYDSSIQVVHAWLYFTFTKMWNIFTIHDRYVNKRQQIDGKRRFESSFATNIHTTIN